MNKRALIENTKGKIFSVIFTKKNKQKRTCNCRLNVNKYIKGKGLNFDPKKKGLIVVFDLQKKDYRLIPLRELLRFKCGKIDVQFDKKNC